MQHMAVVAQLVERWLVVPDVAGSSPVGRPPIYLASSSSVTPDVGEDTSTSVDIAPDVPWVTIVWNDPVNLMSYVAYVFRTYFGVTKEEAERLMLLVHNEGRAVVATGPREEMERHTEAMHEFGLWATVAKASDG
jgi:ATP-dependent Clp protease adaptor protein ClpS